MTTSLDLGNCGYITITLTKLKIQLRVQSRLVYSFFICFQLIPLGYCLTRQLDKEMTVSSVASPVSVSLSSLGGTRLFSEHTTLFLAIKTSCSSDFLYLDIDFCDIYIYKKICFSPKHRTHEKISALVLVATTLSISDP